MFTHSKSPDSGNSVEIIMRVFNNISVHPKPQEQPPTSMFIPSKSYKTKLMALQFINYLTHRCWTFDIRRCGVRMTPKRASVTQPNT